MRCVTYKIGEKDCTFEIKRSWNKTYYQFFGTPDDPGWARSKREALLLAGITITDAEWASRQKS